MIKPLLFCAIALVSFGCSQAEDKQSTSYSCERKVVEAAGDRPIEASLSYYPTTALFASIAGCHGSKVSVSFAQPSERLLFFRRYAGQTELPILASVRFRVAGFEPINSSIVIEKIEFLDRR